MGRRLLLLLSLTVLLVRCGPGQPGTALPWADDFSDPASGWRTESDATATVEYASGVMHVLVHTPDQLAWASAGREFADFHLFVDATQVAGPDDNEYGVLVRMRDDRNFYLFAISGDGYFRVDKVVDQSRELLGPDWMPTDAIHLGASINRLEVICQGPRLTFVVNGQQLAQVEDHTFSRGDIGLYAGSFSEGGVEVHFDNLRVEEP